MLDSGYGDLIVCFGGLIPMVSVPAYNGYNLTLPLIRSSTFIRQLGHHVTTSNIGASIISLHDTPRLHTLKHVIRIFFIWRTYNETSKLTLGFI